MDNLRYLLAAIVGLTLIMSVVSGVNPNYFAGMNAFADEHEEEEDDDNSGSSNDDNEDDEQEEDDDDNSGSGSDDEEDDEEDDDDSEEDDDDDDKGKNKEKDEDDDEDDDDDKFVQSLGNNSKATLEVDDDAELNVEIEDGDLDDGTYDVIFACESPDVDEEFTDALDVEDGEGEFEEDLPLTNGTYTGCEVEISNLSATFPSFTIMASDDHDDDEEDDEHDEDDDSGEEDDDDNKGREESENDRERKAESKLKVEDDGVEVEVEVEGLNMTDGSYDAVFACEDPDFSMTLNDAFDVEDGEGKLEEMIGLANGTYSGCEITVDGDALASFRTFTVSEESDDEQEQRVKEKHKEKDERIVATINGTTLHERHRSQNAASPGEYDPGWDYTLMAAGIANDTDATVDIDLGVWKSNRAIILLDVIGGTVEIENQTYTVVLGYALHSISHDTFRVGALAVDDDGNVYKLKMRGTAVDDDAEFPTESGSIELTFGGSSGPSNNRFGDWELDMDGTITAG